MKRLAFILIVLSVFSSCKRLAYAYIGFHSPRLETPTSISKFNKKKKLKIDELLMVSKDSILTCISKDVCETYIFDIEGIKLNFNSTFPNSSCSGNVINVIKGLSKSTFYQRDSLNTLEKESKKWVYLFNNEPYSDSIKGKTDYVIVCYWNLFGGSPNHKNKIRDLRKAVEGNSSVSFKLIFVNQDIREGMGIILDTASPK
jgi:hypothetical protein